MLTKNDLQAIEQIVDRRVSPLEKKMDRGFKRVHKEINDVLGYLDKEVVKTNKRVDRVERHLGLPAVN